MADLSASVPLQEMKERLRQAVSRARTRAAALRRPVLACAAVELPAETPQPEVSALDGRFCVYEQPSLGRCLLGYGEAIAFSGRGAQRFRALREASARLFSEAVVERGPLTEAVLPLCFAGFAFDPARRDPQLWQGFDDGYGFVPRILLSRSGASCWLAASLLVSASSPEAEVGRLLLEVEEVLNGAKKRSSEEPRRVSLIPASSSWHESVAALTAAIGRGEVNKVVLARRVELAADRPFHLDAVLTRLRVRYPTCTLFAAGTGQACFLGATPEMLVRLRDGTVYTDCLAGSAPRSEDPARDEALGKALLADDKERREHAFVVDFQLQALQPLCQSIEAPERPALRRMANVQHLHTPVRALPLPDSHVLDFVEALHPTPATAGSPTPRALCLIRQQEAFGRGWYAGPLGWLDAAGNGEFAVALRSGLVRGHTAWLFAGCGIVAGSDPQREFQESAIKLQAMQWALGLAPGAACEGGI